MPDAASSTVKVHWIGAGLSTGSGLRELCDAGLRVLLWHRTEQRAAASLERLGLTGRAGAHALTDGALEAMVAPGDVVVSMLPAGEHAGLVRLCVRKGAHFACSSYVSDAIEAAAAAAAETGVVVLTEAGLDPGIDHLLAHSLMDRARDAVGTGPAAVDFTSYCGGIPAVPNDFRYRFSWAPRAVLTALRSPARYIEDGEQVTAELPWEAARPCVVRGEAFEVYPNRDSVPFVEEYRLPAAWRPRSFVRGTLRLDGWLKAWEPVFTELRGGDDEAVGALAEALAARYPTTEQDRDRVVLAVGLAVRGDDGRAWSGDYLLDVTGDAEESAMARCVSLPLAFGVMEILAGRTEPGLRRAARSPQAAERWLSYLADRGVVCSLRVGAL